MDGGRPLELWDGFLELGKKLIFYVVNEKKFNLKVIKKNLFRQKIYFIRNFCQLKFSAKPRKA